MSTWHPTTAMEEWFTKGWTYGAEHEWADWPYETELPKDYGRDVRDDTMINSNGVAVDPRGNYYSWGGEISKRKVGVSKLSSVERIPSGSSVKSR